MPPETGQEAGDGGPLWREDRPLRHRETSGGGRRDARHPETLLVTGGDQTGAQQVSDVSANQPLVCIFSFQVHSS